MKEASPRVLATPAFALACCVALGGCFLTGYGTGAPERDELDGGGLDDAQAETGSRREGGRDREAPDGDPRALDAGLALDSSLPDALVEGQDADVTDGQLDASGDGAEDAGAPADDDYATWLGDCADESCGEIVPCDGGTCEHVCPEGSNSGPGGGDPVDCTFDCSNATACTGICPANGVCQTGCAEAAICRAVCQSGSECRVGCFATEHCKTDCLEGSECDVTCADPGCEFHCFRGAECLMRCAADVSCSFATCEDETTACADNTIVCGRDCP